MPSAITLSDDAYEKLERRRREGEYFSDVVMRLTSDATLSEYHGVLDDSTADELSRAVEKR